jgi:hypothetical protein
MGQWSKRLPLQNKKRPLQSETTPDQKNVAHPVLVDKSKIYFPPLHIKVGFRKVSVKAMDEESEGYGYLRQIFSKMKEGIFIGP